MCPQVSYAVQNQRPFVVRGGGHSNGFSTVDSPGIIIDLSRMRKVTVDVERQVVVAQGGATMGDGVKAASSVGMAVATGTCNEVGLVREMTSPIPPRNLIMRNRSALPLEEGSGAFLGTLDTPQTPCSRCVSLWWTRAE